MPIEKIPQTNDIKHNRRSTQEMQLKKHNKNEHFIFPLKKKTYKEKTNGLIAKGDHLVNVHKSIFS